MRFNERLQVVCQCGNHNCWRRTRSSHPISINFRSDEAVRVTTDRSGPTGSVPLHENRLVGRESVGLCAQPVDAPEPFSTRLMVVALLDRDTELTSGTMSPGTATALRAWAGISCTT